MDFSKIDFSAISRMLDQMSDEQKEQINDMAKSFLDKEEVDVDDDGPLDFYAFLNLDEEAYSTLPGMALDQIEAASDFEQFYDDDHTVDFSASILFYAKAILTILRKIYFPVFKVFFTEFHIEQTTTISQFLSVLESEQNVELLTHEGFLVAFQWIEIRNFLRSWLVLLNRAQFDRIGYEELQSAKQTLFDHDYLLSLYSMY